MRFRDNFSNPLKKIVFSLITTDKLLPPIFPSQIHIQPDIKIPILQQHHQQHAMLAHSQNVTVSQANAQEILLGGVPTSHGGPSEHFITVSHASHLPHVSNLSRHINAR